MLDAERMTQKLMRKCHEISHKKDRPHGAALGDQKQPALSEQPCIEGGR